MTEKQPEQVPVKEGIFHRPESPGDKPYLITKRCRECGYISFPSLAVCPRCLKKDTMEEAHISGKGKIDMFASCFAALPGFPAPTLQGYVALEGGGRIWSLITGVDPADETALKIGTEVELVIEKLRDDAEGREVMSYKFRPVAAGQGGKQ